MIKGTQFHQNKKKYLYCGEKRKFILRIILIKKSKTFHMKKKFKFVQK